MPAPRRPACTASQHTSPPPNCPLTPYAPTRAQLYACPPTPCLYGCKGCSGHEFSAKGVKGCLPNNNSLVVGTTYSIPFIVCDKWIPVAGSATAIRTVYIVNPCTGTAKPNYCNGKCYAVACGVASSVSRPQTLSHRP